MKPLYLDYAAATPLDPSVLTRMQPYFGDHFYNPSAGYRAAVSVRQALDSARSSIASWLGCRGSEVVFTAGATEANNLAIHGIMARYPESSMLFSGVEHDSVIAAAKQYRSYAISVDNHGRVDLNDLERKIDDSTVLVSIMYANNEVGTIQPLRLVAKSIQAARNDRRERGITLPLFLHSDAAQAGNYLDLHIARLGVDLMSLNGGKMYGPKQSGCLFIRAGVVLQPLILGGGQERGLRSGTENVPADIGIAAALSMVQKDRPIESRRLQDLRIDIEQRLKGALPPIVINGPINNRLPNIMHITIPGVDNERLLFQLDEQGILVSAGSACSASNDEPSSVLTAMGLSEAAARSSIRMSLGRGTTKADGLRLIAAIQATV